MAWSAPMTAVTAAPFTAAQFNVNVRDNLLETETAKLLSAGQYVVATGTNAVAARSLGNDEIAASCTRTSTSFADPDTGTAGPTVTLTTGSRAFVLVHCNATVASTSNEACMGVAVSGASTIAATGDAGFCYKQTSGTTSQIVQGSFGWIMTGLTPGSNTFTAKYAAPIGGTGTFTRRILTVMPL